MNLLIILLRIFEVIICLMLIGIILLQRTKGSGAGVSFGGGMAESLFGAQMGNVLTKGTVILGIVFLMNTIVLSILQAKQSGVASDGSLMDAEPPPVPAATVPGPAGDPAAALPERAPAADAASALDDLPRGDAPPAAPAAAPEAPAAAATPAPAAP